MGIYKVVTGNDKVVADNNQVVSSINEPVARNHKVVAEKNEVVMTKCTGGEVKPTVTLELVTHISCNFSSCRNILQRCNNQ